MAVYFIYEVILPALNPTPARVLALEKEIQEKKELYKRRSTVSTNPSPALRRALEELEAEIRNDSIALRLLRKMVHQNSSKYE